MTNIGCVKVKVILLPKSSNAKTGNVIQSYSSRSTCPERCPFKDDKGCYADGLRTSRIWDRCENPKDDRFISNEKELKVALTDFLLEMTYKDPRAKVLFHHNVAGDIAIKGTSTIDANIVKTLSNAVEFANSISTTGNLMGYTYTHCEISAGSAKVIHEAASKGFLINASCETVREVLHAIGLGVDAVITSVNPEKTIRELKDNGLYGVQCPAQLKLGQVTEGMTCEKCRLCSSHREAIVIFEVHGRAHKRATKVIMLKQQNSSK